MSDINDKEFETARMMYINIMTPVIKICTRSMSDDEKIDVMTLIHKSFYAGWKSHTIASNHDVMVKAAFDESNNVIDKMMKG